MKVADENKNVRLTLCSPLLVFLAVLSCCRCSSPAPPAEQPEPEEAPAEQPKLEQAVPEQPEPEEAPAEQQEAAVEEQPEAPIEPAKQEPQPAEEYVVSEEVYSKTFDEIEEFIRNLNEIIRREDYDTWLTYLSDEYIERTSDPAYLKQQSEQPLLKKHNINLDSLRDYFEYVVVPSRVQAKLDEIEFVDENQVKAYAMIRNTKALLYLLVREDDKWKIGVW
jgi:hypothetical protein